MSDGRPKLSLFGGGEAGDQFLTDANRIDDLPEESFEAFCDAVFDEDTLVELCVSPEDVVVLVEEVVDFDADELNAILEFSRLVVVSACKRDLLESQVRQDLISAGMREERADRFGENIIEHSAEIRQLLLHNSRVDPLPDLREMNWTIDKIVSTPAVERINERRILLEFVIDRDEETEVVRFQADEAAIAGFLSQAMNLGRELSVGIEDIE